MNRILFALVTLMSSFASYAQYDRDTSESRVEGSYPELRAPAPSERRISAGLSSGVSSPNGPATSSTEYGLVVAAQPIDYMGAGIEANTTRLNSDNDIRQTNVLLRGTYTVGGDIPFVRNMYAGVGAGPVFVSNRVRWAGAPLVGFDVPLSNKSHDFLSLGLEAKYMFITNTDVPNIFASGLAVKYWF